MITPVRFKNDYPTRMNLQRRRGKSPLAIESIDDLYCRHADLADPAGVVDLAGLQDQPERFLIGGP